MSNSNKNTLTATTPSERLAAALNAFEDAGAEMARAERAESEWGWTSPSGSEARCWWNDCASSHPSLDAGLTEAMNMDDGTIAAIDGWAVTPVEGRWVVLGEASDSALVSHGSN